MDTIKGIEGDYIETKENNLIFDVKGLLHPIDRKICFLRFYPNKDGDRIRNNVIYKKVYNLNERYSILREKFPKYLFFSEELDLELQGVRNKDIKKIYTPREYFKKICEKKHLSYLEKCSKELCELFITGGGVLENSIGITGSQMVGLDIESSDIDIIIYGTQLSLEFQNNLKMILNSSKNCRKYNLEEYGKHYKWRANSSNVSFEDFMRSELRKLHQGKFKGIDFFIRYIKSPEDWCGNFYDYKYKNYGRIKIISEIIDSKDSIFTPYSYKINTIKIVENNSILKEINVKDIIEIASFRARFCEQAIKGETVLVEGKLESVEVKGKEKHFRLILGDQNKDKMIILV